MPLLSGKIESVHDAMFGFYMDFQRMVRTDRYKLIRYPHNGEVQLFDLKNDPWEKYDLAENPTYLKTRKGLGKATHGTPEKNRGPDGGELKTEKDKNYRLSIIFIRSDFSSIPIPGMSGIRILPSSGERGRRTRQKVRRPPDRIHCRRFPDPHRCEERIGDRHEGCTVFATTRGSPASRECEGTRPVHN